MSESGTRECVTCKETKRDSQFDSPKYTSCMKCCRKDPSLRPVKPVIPDNELFTPAHDNTRNSATRFEQARKDLPPPRLVDLTGINAALQTVEDEELRVRVTNFLNVLLEGGKHKEALLTNNFSWNNIQNLHHKFPKVKELYMQVKEIGEEYRSILRLDAAHERACEGVDDPIYSPSGKYLGSRKLYSDRLLEMLLKADNPTRFREMKQVEVVGTQLRIGVFDRDELKKELVDEMESAVVEEVVDG